ncbi:FAD-dependent monooxygenase [Micromonospora sp. BRA006-A]|nr:FAD-dependent monooxygenase [Micromonospora sp. BRA006-A]
MSWELPGLPYAHLGLPQYETERILTDRLATLGVRPQRGAELVDFTQDADGVTATVRTADGGTETVRAAYLVGADGAHSRVRERLGLTFTGGLGRFPQLFMLVDVDVDWDMPDGHLLRFLHMTDGQMDGMLVCVPLRGAHRYRIATLAPPRFFAQTGGRDAPPGFSEELDEPTIDDVQAALDRSRATRHPGEQPALVLGVPDQPGIVDRYRDGRVFVAGDAAHLHPPAGGQGANTGIQDTWNLAWKLALAVRGLAAPGLLDSYETERRPEGEEIVGRAVRMAGTEEVDRADLERQFLQEMSMLLSYAGSPLVGETVADPAALGDAPRPGDIAPDVDGLRRRGVGHPLRLRDHPGHPAHAAALRRPHSRRGELAALTGLCADARRLTGGGLEAYLLLDPDADEPRLLDPPVVRDAERRFRGAYGLAGTGLYLIRPDGHIGFRGAPVDPDALRKHLHLVFGSVR